MTARRSEGGLYIGPGCPARPAAARLRRACGGAHSRPAADPTETALDPLASVRQGFSQQMSIDSFMVRNLTQNRRNIFHLNCVPRHDVPHTYKGKVWSFTVKEGAESRQVKD